MPTTEVLGICICVIITVSLDELQVPLLTVHTNLFCPLPKLLSVVLLFVELVITPLPETNVHRPVPTAGKVAKTFALDAHNTWSVPAFAALGED